MTSARLSFYHAEIRLINKKNFKKTLATRLDSARLRAMTTITYQNCGTNWIVFIDGETHEEIEQHFFSFWNWNATSGELAWLTEGRARFWTTKERMQSYFENICLMELIDSRPNDFKGKKFGAFPEAKRLASERLASLKAEKVLTFGTNDEPYELGVISAEKPDEDLKSSFAFHPFWA